jgi:deazaflavin-dependent oxidoreductase (nitroreductase family)
VCSSEIASTRVNNDVSTALHRSQLIDLTTTGRRSALPRRIEIFLHDEDGVLFITGMPRRDRTRDWIHNITADPNVIVHLKKGIEADVPATARVVTDPHEARPLIEAAACQWPVGTARRRPAELPAGGHGNCPRMANRSAHRGLVALAMRGVRISSLG